MDLDAVFVAELLCPGNKLRVLRVEADLDDSTTVAHVNENKSAEIAALLYPAEQMDCRSDVGLPEISTVVSTHNSS